MSEYAAIVEEAVRPWIDDPERLIEELWPDLALRQWQRTALRSLPAGLRHAWRTSRGAGKTVLLAFLAWWWAFTRGDRGLVILFVSSWRQAAILWGALTELWHKSPRLRALCPGWEILKDSVRDERGRSVIVAVSSEGGEFIEGFHAPSLDGGGSLLILGDECKAIGDDAYRSTRGWLASAEETLEIYASTPGRSIGFFHRLFSDERFQVLRVKAADVPELAEWEKEMRAEYDERDPLLRTQVDADFAGGAEDFDALIPLSLIEPAFGRTAAPDGTRWPRVLGVDPAGGGSNEFCCVLRNGPIIEEIVAWVGEPDQRKNAARVVEIARRFGPEPAVIDKTGLGDGIYSRLAEIAGEDQRFGGRFRAVPFIAAHSPAKRDAALFQNLKTSIWYKIRAKYFETATLCLPAGDRRLSAQLAALTVVLDTKGRSRVVDPSPSPDRADAVHLSLAYDFIAKYEYGVVISG